MKNYGCIIVRKANVGIVSDSSFSFRVRWFAGYVYLYFKRTCIWKMQQTGNIVLLSQHIFAGNWADVMRYLMPVLSFMLWCCGGN